MIVSFYSYKGGVGRSQLCANIASYLCIKKGKKVLLWDWDFEAPGLHFFFDKTNIDFTVPGTIELLEDYTAMMRTQPSVSKEDYQFFLKSSMINLKKGEVVKGKIGKIDLIPGGNYNNDFTSKVNNFNWYEFYELLDGKEYIESLKSWLKDLDYDYILIDSRTGLNDYSGICNLQLPDTNVVVMAANEQNISGCKKIINQIVNHEYTKKFRSSYVLPILSRINVNNPVYQKWSERFVDEFHKLLDELDQDVSPFTTEIFRDFYLDKTLLEDDPRFSAGENILITNKKQTFPRGSLAAKYTNISEYLEGLDTEKTIRIVNQIDEDTWTSYAEEAVDDNINEKAAYAYDRANDIEHSIQYGGTSNSFNKKGNNEWIKNNLDNAMKYFQKSLELNPQNTSTLSSLGNGYFEKGDFDLAIQAFQKVIQIKSDNHEAIYCLGNSYYKKGDFNLAIQAFQKAIQIKPNYLEAFNNMGVTYRRKGEFDLAIRAFQKAIQIKPNDPDPFNGLGYVFFASGKIMQAEIPLKNSISLGSKDFANMNLGHVRLGQNQEEEALKCYLKSINSFSDENSFWRDMNDDLQYLKQYGITDDYYQSVIEKLRLAYKSQKDT